MQTYTPDTITIRSDREYFQIRGGTIWDGRTLYELYGEAYTPWDWQPKLKQVADDLGLDFFSSAFDSTAVDFLENMGVPAYKLASCELVDIPLLQRISRTGKPLIISTGMATIEEIEEAVSDSSPGRRRANRVAQVHQRLPRAPLRNESADHSRTGAKV